MQINANQCGFLFVCDVCVCAVCGVCRMSVSMHANMPVS